MDHLSCPFRKEVDGKLVCGLTQKILGIQDDNLYIIEDETCAKCYATNNIPTIQKINEVVKTNLVQSANQVIEKDYKEEEKQRAKELLDYISGADRIVAPTAMVNRPHAPCNCNKPKIRTLNRLPSKLT